MTLRHYAPRRSLVVVLAVAATMTSVPLLLWTVGGLETTLFATAATLAVAAAARDRLVLAQAAAVLAVLARPEGALFWALVSAYGAWRARRMRA